MRKLSQKWCIVAAIEPLNVGDEFHYKEWPLHVTIAPTFAFNKGSDELAALIQAVLANAKSTYLKPYKQLQWSNHKVTAFQDQEHISNLHTLIYKSLIDSGAEFDQPQYVGDNYIAHCTDQNGRSVIDMPEITISTLALVDMFPGSDGYRRKVKQVFSLKRAINSI